jgi:uncharacterized membrane protein YedE/YeeE
VHDWTPSASLLGGALIGLAASLLLWSTGRIAGISGIVAELLLGARGDRAWRAAFLAGLIAAGLACALLWPDTVGASPRSLPVVAGAGILVGVGTRLGNGCTSGHGVCGISRLSPRSIVATLTFMATGMLTVALWRWFSTT